MSQFNDYQAWTNTTWKGAKDPRDNFTVAIFGLPGEVGEILENYKKHLRDGTHFDLIDFEKELGDVQYYIAQAAAQKDIPLQTVINTNQEKLNDRLRRGVLGGSGDNR